MTDNIDVDPGITYGRQPVATDYVGEAHYQRIKLIHGAEGVNDGDVSSRNPLPIVPGNGSADAFGAFRVSTQETLIEEKNVSVSPLIGNKAENGGIVTRSAQRSSFILSTGGSANGSARRQSRQRAPYQPGKSQNCQLTFVGSTPSDNIVQEVWFGDDNNGLGFIADGTEFYFFIRSDTSGTPVMTKIPRSSWIDPLDGTGESGIVLDLSKAQIFQLDFQWLGVGSVRFGFVFNGHWVICYQNNWSNIGDSVYLRNPNFPISWRIYSTGSTQGKTLEAICGKIASEGGFDRRGLSLAFETPDAGVDVSTALTEVLAIRLTASGVELAAAFLSAVRILCTTNADFRYRVFINDTGMSGGTWIPKPGSLLEYNVTRTGTPGSGIQIDANYGSKSSDAGVTDIVNRVGFGYDINTSEADVFSLCIQGLAVGTETYHAALIARQEA